MQAPEHNPDGATVPPSLQILPWLRVASFTRTRAGDLVRLELEGELRRGARPPRSVEIRIERGGSAQEFEPVTCSVERLSGVSARSARARLALRFTFLVPAALIDTRATPPLTLALICPRRGRVELPTPATPTPDDSAATRLSARTIASAAAIAGATLLAAPAASLAQGVSASKPPNIAGSRRPHHERHAHRKKHRVSALAGSSTSTVGSTSTTATGPTTTTGPSTTATPGSSPGPSGPGPNGASGSGSGSSSGSPSPAAPTPGIGGPPGFGGGGGGTGAGTGGTPNPTGGAPVGTGTSTGNKTVSATKLLNAGAKAGGSALKPVLRVKHENHSTNTSHKPSARRAHADGGAAIGAKPGAAASTPGLTPLNFAGFSGFGSITPWGNGVFENPFTQAQLERFAEIAGDKVNPPQWLIADYRQAARKYQIPWEVLAAINYIETGYGRDLAVSPAGAVGWMQFMPATWAQYGEIVRNIETGRHGTSGDAVLPATAIDALTPLGEAKVRDALQSAQARAIKAAAAANAARAARKLVASAAADSDARDRVDTVKFDAAKFFGPHSVSPAAVDGHPNPWNPRDAIFAAARMLVADGAHRDMPRAVFAYNHADWYVQEVLTVAQKITRDDINQRSKPEVKIAAMRAEAQLLNGMAYKWGGGHAADNWLVTTGYDCSGFVSAVLHAAGYLSYPVTTETLPGQRGIDYGVGKYVTIYDRTDAAVGQNHVIIDLDGQWWESGGSTTAGGAAMVHRITKLNRTYLQSFNVVMHPRGL